MPARKATLQYRIEYRGLGDTEWQATDEVFDSFAVAVTRLRQFGFGAKRLVQRRVQAGDWTELDSGIIG